MKEARFRCIRDFTLTLYSFRVNKTIEDDEVFFEALLHYWRVYDRTRANNRVESIRGISISLFGEG